MNLSSLCFYAFFFFLKADFQASAEINRFFIVDWLAF